MRLKRTFDTAISVLLLLLLVITLTSAIGLLPPLFIQLHNKAFVLVILAFVILFAVIFSGKFSTLLQLMSNTKVLLTFKVIFGILTAFWQILLVLSLSGYYGWDPNALITSSFFNETLDPYFSKFPNNFLLVSIFRLFKTIFRFHSEANFVLFLSITTVLIVDITALLIYRFSYNIFNRSIANISVICYWIIFMISPNAIVVYTDAWSVFTVSLMLYFYSLVHVTDSNRAKIVNLVLFGFSTSLCYLMKPSTMVFIIALVIESALSYRRSVQKRALLTLLKNICIFIVGFMLLALPFEFYEHNNHFIKIDPDQKTPATLFVAMGMTNDGGWNANDYNMNGSFKSGKAANRYFKKVIVKRAKNYKSPINYGKFLVQKQIHNSADGSLGWGQEGHPFFIGLPVFKTSNKLILRVRSTFFNVTRNKNYGVHDNSMGGYVFFPQIIWCTIIASVLINVSNRNRTTSLFRLTLFGGLLFLLIFEGGRSRYLIQYLPFIVILAGSGLFELMQIINRYQGAMKTNISF